MAEKSYQHWRAVFDGHNNQQSGSNAIEQVILNRRLQSMRLSEVSSFIDRLIELDPEAVRTYCGRANKFFSENKPRYRSFLVMARGKLEKMALENPSL